MDKILNRIRALLAQAEDPAATPEEAEAFSRKAEEQILKYGVERALLAASTEDRGKPTLKVFEYGEPYGKAKATLLNGIAEANGCKVVRIRDFEGTRLHVVGFEQDLEIVEVLYTSLLLQGTNALLHQYRSDRSFRTSYWYGFAGRVAQRLNQMRARAEREVKESGQPGTDIVLASREHEVAAFFREKHPNIRSASRPSVRSREGYGSGQSAADRADLGQSRVGGARRSIGR